MAAPYLGSTFKIGDRVRVKHCLKEIIKEESSHYHVIPEIGEEFIIDPYFSLFDGMEIVEVFHKGLWWDRSCLELVEDDTRYIIIERKNFEDVF